MRFITANELKTRGVTALEEHLSSEDEVIISVRGKEKFVVVSVEKYAALREFELEQAVREARADYEAGRVVRESVDQHIKRLCDAV
jgi:PHD/YefM family antitoxin component YafN of YafNO toxin-antitoxin module